MLLAQIPQTARVNKKEVKAPDVAFQGDPEFEPIETTTVQRAVNTDKDVFKVGELVLHVLPGRLVRRQDARPGPWEVASRVPEQIYQIPVSSPAHHVTYVTVEDNDDEWVTFAAAAGYTGMMVAWGCTVWGTGWYYPPYYRATAATIRITTAHFPTYGYSAWYNPWTGAYGRSAGVYGPYGGAGVGARYNPRTGTYARGAAAYGPYGARGVAQAYNPRTGTYAATRQGSNVYGSWGSTAVQRGDDWAKTNRYTNRQTGTTTRTIRTDEGSAVTRRGADGGARRRRATAATSTPARTATSIGKTGRHLAEVRQRRLVEHRPAAVGRRGRRRGSRRPDGSHRPPTRTADRSTVDQLNRDSRRARRGRAANQRLRQLPRRQRHRGTGSYRGGGARSGGGGLARRRAPAVTRIGPGSAACACRELRDSAVGERAAHVRSLPFSRSAAVLAAAGSHPQARCLGRRAGRRTRA